MRVNFVLISMMILLQGCKHFPIKDFPLQLKTIVEGEIKGFPVFCENDIDFNKGGWGFLCGMGNGIDVKYRVKPITNDKSQLDLMITQNKAGTEKVVALPTLIVKRSNISRNTIEMAGTNITVMAEHIK
jgi:hypothetical protein